MQHKVIRQFGPAYFRAILHGDYTLEIIKASERIELAVWVGSCFARTIITAEEITRAKAGWNDANRAGEAPIGSALAVIEKLTVEQKEQVIRYVVHRQALRAVYRHLGPFPCPSHKHTGTLEDVAYRYRQQRSWWWSLIPTKKPRIFTPGLSSKQNDKRKELSSLLSKGIG